MSRKFLILTLSLFAVPGLTPVLAQDADLAEIRKQIDIFSGVLREGLGLEASRGFLGISSGRVEGIYLQEQGALFEIRTPLASQRNRVSLSAMASSISSRASRDNPFEAVMSNRQESLEAASRAVSDASQVAVDAYRRSLAELRTVDIEVAVENAIRQATMRARMLQYIGALESDGLSVMEEELDALRQRLEESLTQLRELAEADGEIDGEPTVELAPGEDRLQQLEQSLLEIRDRARERAEEMNSRYQQAREAYRESWEQEVLVFENHLYALLCAYGAGLRALGDAEYVTVVMPGLGEETEDGMPKDRIHVITRSDLSACQSGSISWEALRQRANRYSF